MFKKGNKRNFNIDRRKRKKTKRNIFFYLILFIFIIFFTFSDNIVVDEKTGNIAIVKSNKIKTKEFSRVYTGSVLSGDSLEFNIDLNNVYFTGSTVDLEFSNNKDFINYTVGDINNNIKIRFGYMLGRSRNKNEVFWVGKVTESVKKIQYDVLSNNEDGRLAFKLANLNGGRLYIRATLKGREIIK